jgi:hypothetical protein
MHSKTLLLPCHLHHSLNLKIADVTQHTTTTNSLLIDKNFVHTLRHIKTQFNQLFHSNLSFTFYRWWLSAPAHRVADAPETPPSPTWALAPPAVFGFSSEYKRTCCVS